MGYLVVTAVLVVPFGRLGDMFGRVKIYNIRLRRFHAGRDRAVLRPLPPRRWGDLADRVAGGPGRRRRDADVVVVGHPHRRVPSNQRGMALGVNMVAAVSGSFLGLLIGGCSPRSTGRPSSGSACRSASSAPCGRALAQGTRCAQPRPDGLGGHADLRRRPDRSAHRYHLRGSSPTVSRRRVDQPEGARRAIGGLALLVVFCLVELRVLQPMVDVRLFRSAAFGMATWPG